MREIGEILRKKREEKGLSYKDVQEAIKIRAYYLSAIEAGNFEAIPGEVYLKGFITNYATFLGLDRNEILNQYYQAKKEIINLEAGSETPDRDVINYFAAKMEKYPYKLGIYLSICLITIILIGLSLFGLFGIKNNNEEKNDFLTEGRKKLYSSQNENKIPSAIPTIYSKQEENKNILEPKHEKNITGSIKTRLSENKTESHPTNYFKPTPSPVKIPIVSPSPENEAEIVPEIQSAGKSEANNEEKTVEITPTNEEKTVEVIPTNEEKSDLNQELAQ